MMRWFWKFCLIALIAVSVNAISLDKYEKLRRFNKQLRKRTVASKNGPANVDFQAKELPCQFVINRTNTAVFPDEDSVGYEYDIFSVRGTLYKSFILIPDQVGEELVIRPDVRIVDPDPHVDKAYVARFHCLSMFDPPCDNILMEEQAAIDSVKDDLDWWYSPWVFINVTNGTFQGHNCKVYYDWDEEDQTDVYLYATVDNMIVGLETFSPDGNQSITVDYVFSAPQRIFVISKDLFATCNDTRAYNRTNIDPCSKQSSSAMRIGVNFIISIIAVSMTVIFMFF